MKLMLTLLFAGIVSAHEHIPQKAQSANFQRLKQAVGTWEGTMKENGKDVPVTVTYKLMGNGTTIEETLGPGTPNAMVDMYYDDGGQLAMTHFCAMGNRPEMKATKTEPNKIALEFWKAPDFDPKKDMHMHGLTLVMPDADHLEQQWQHYENGKQTETAVFRLTRKAEPMKEPAKAKTQ